MKTVLSKLLFAFLLFSAVSAQLALAQEEGAIKVHLTQSVAVPNRLLTAGDYTFRLVESTSGANFVKVLSADEKTFYALVPIYRTQRADTTDISTVNITADANGVSRVDSWFLPANHDGYRFIYKRSDLQKLERLAQKKTEQSQSPSGF